MVESTTQITPTKENGSRQSSKFNFTPTENGGFLFDYQSGFIYLLNKDGAQLLKSLWNNECQDQELSNLRPCNPIIKRHAVINTLSPTGGKMGHSIFPFDRREAAMSEGAEEHKPVIPNNTDGHKEAVDVFINSLREYGILTQ